MQMKLFSTTSWKYCPTVAQLNTKRSDIQKIFTKRSHKHLPKIYPRPENQVILPKSSTHTTPPLHVRMRNQLYFYGLPISNVTTFLNFVLPHKFEHYLKYESILYNWSSYFLLWSNFLPNQWKCYSFFLSVVLVSLSSLRLRYFCKMCHLSFS